MKNGEEDFEKTLWEAGRGRESHRWNLEEIEQGIGRNVEEESLGANRIIRRLKGLSNVAPLLT